MTDRENQDVKTASNAVCMEYTVLIVDDSPTNLRILSELLRNEYNVKIAANGTAALDSIHSNEPPDIVLMDVVMPGLSGIDVCRQMQSDPILKLIPVILVSADDPPPCPRAGEIDYIRKPFEPADLLRRVHKALQGKG